MVTTVTCFSVLIYLIYRDPSFELSSKDGNTEISNVRRIPGNYYICKYCMNTELVFSLTHEIKVGRLKYSRHVRTA